MRLECAALTCCSRTCCCRSSFFNFARAAFKELTTLSLGDRYPRLDMYPRLVPDHRPRAPVPAAPSPTASACVEEEGMGGRMSWRKLAVMLCLANRPTKTFQAAAAFALASTEWGVSDPPSSSRCRSQVCTCKSLACESRGKWHPQSTATHGQLQRGVKWHADTEGVSIESSCKHRHEAPSHRHMDRRMIMSYDRRMIMSHVPMSNI